MENKITTDQLIQDFTNQFRVITLGGVAMIAHGLSRNTYAMDIW